MDIIELYETFYWPSDREFYTAYSSNYNMVHPPRDESHPIGEQEASHVTKTHQPESKPSSAAASGTNFATMETRTRRHDNRTVLRSYGSSLVGV